MKDIREILNISYFDNKELNLKEHCNIYSNIKKDLISILNKYDIKYVVADTELIRDLSKENQELKKKLEERPKEYVFIGNAQNKTRDFINQIIKENREYKEAIDKAIEYIEQHAITVTDGNITTNKHELLEILKEVE